ncbi:hypothetical protein CC2G_002012 [Coprinopsis cinerea AmutBmut pab1-1]|nr:hypothetical protein CC2G_002012 [Coprinopsis cinerea AmutBmut pab1-1]
MSLTWTWLQLLGHIRTWSAHNAYQEQHPDDLNAPEDTRFLEEDLDAIRGTSYDESFIRGGDVSIRFWKNLREAAARDIAVSSSKGGNGEVDGGAKLLDKITVDSPMPLLLVGKS